MSSRLAVRKKSVEGSFVKAFGKQQAEALKDAAAGHQNGIHDKKGSDPFKWVCLIAIGYQCVELDRYRESHGITISFKKFQKWCIEHGDLGTHDGDCDYLTLITGRYSDFIKKEKKP